jgi:hypothetical protein
MSQKSEKDWLHTADDFYERTSFPNCLGAVDGKHIRMCKPDDGGSLFFNYKNLFSIALMSVAFYCFISTDEGAYGESSDCNILKNSNVNKILEANILNIPASRPLLIEDNGTPITFVIVGYEAFALSHVLRPYPSRNLDVVRRIYNCRLTRARRLVKCAFGVVCNKWRMMHRAIDVYLDLCDVIIKTCCILHTFLSQRDCFQFQDTLYNVPSRVIRLLALEVMLQERPLENTLRHILPPN